MKYVKLDKPGARHVVHVKTVDVNKDGKWPDYHFSDGEVVVVVPKAAADRQITKERMGVTAAVDLIGSYLAVSRTEKLAANGNPYWDLNIASASDAQEQAQSARVPSPYQGGAKPDDGDPGPTEPQEPDEPRRTPREEREAAADPAERRERFLGFYLQVYETMLSAMERTHLDSGVTLTADAVQAATATVIIQMDRKGML